jgi:hypothetical protein
MKSNGIDDDIYNYIQPSIRTTTTDDKKSTLEFFFFEVFNVNMNLIDIVLIPSYEISFQYTASTIT